MNIAIVSQIGFDIGLGHLSRMLALASATQENPNCNLQLIIQGEPISKKELAQFQHQYISADNFFNQKLIALISSQRIQLIVFDICSLKITESFYLLLKELRDLSVKIVGIDGILYSQFCDWIHIPAFFVDPKKISTCPCSVSYGWDSYLLSTPENHASWKPGHKILILTGGADVTQLSQSWPRIIDMVLPRHCEIHWVQGPYSKPPALPDILNLSWIIYKAPENLTQIMTKINYTITTFGVSLFEALQQGIPTIVFSPYGDRDKIELTMLQKENICVISKNEIDAIEALPELMQNTLQAEQFSERSKRKLNVSGAKLLAQCIFSMETA